jgi:Domain of unknown function (DUF4386)
MKTSKTTGRVIGAWLFAQFIGLLVGFVLLMPAVGTDYLTVDSGMESAMRAGVIFLLASAAITLGLAFAAFPVFRAHSERTALWLLAISAVWLVIQSVDNVYLLSMMSLGKRYAQDPAANADVYNSLAAGLRSTRLFAHYTELLVMDVWFVSLYGALFAFRLVPRALGAVAVLAVAVHIVGLPLATFIGYPVVLNLAYGNLVAYVLIIGWLLARGFPESSLDAENV